MQKEKRGGKDTCARWLSAVYLLLALLALGRTCAVCYPGAVETARMYLGGRTAQAFSALTDALGDRGSVSEAFSAVTGHEGQD